LKALLVGVTAESESIVTRALGTYGHDQIVVVEGAAALELLRTSSPALVIVQAPLVDMTGAQFCHRARACLEGRDAIILVITGGVDELQSVLDAGATDLHATSLGAAALEIRVRIAERLVAEHAKLRDRELRFRRLFESGVAGVTISDLDGNFKEANDAFLRMLGYTHEEMVEGKLNWGVISPLDRLVSDTEDRIQLRATGFLPLRERDYIHKDGRHIAALEGSAMLEGTPDCISYVADISVRKREVEALRASEMQYRALFDHSPLPKYLYDHETLRFVAVNAATIRGYGYSREEFLRMTLDDIRSPEDPPKVEVSLEAHGLEATRSERHRRKDGSPLDVEVTVRKFDLGPRPCGLAVAVDVTNRNRMEDQLRQSQKMEAIGSLAGGVAHDFNNLLSVILGYGELLATDFMPGDPMRGDLQEILRAARCAADLTRQLLAFSRHQMLQPRVLDLNSAIEVVAKMLRRVVGEDVELSVLSGPDLGWVTADPGQIEQILMNLAVNARDAMPKGGKLTIETSNVEIDSTDALTRPEIKPGSYVVLAVSDTGGGMSPATRDRVFEPFFTTKEKGKGTGFGLSTVFGIVQQSGGSVFVESALGKGTTFTVYLPRADLAAGPSAVAVPENPTQRGTETILLVEDEEPVRAVVRTILQRQGYAVLAAESGGDALLICEQHKGPIDVLLTDVVMPRMSGRELSERLGPLRPDMKVLLMSGYTDDSILQHGVLHSDVAFLQKPITPETLSRKLREVIDSAPQAGRGRPASAAFKGPSAYERRSDTDIEATSGTFGVLDPKGPRKAG
jgi:two-component system, cell cycle sensor histidine kinase and response regulator CckA